MFRQQKDQFEQSINLRFLEGDRKLTAFLTNFKTRTFVDIEEAQQRMALLCYFQDENGNIFKALYAFNPYLYVGFENKNQAEVRMYIQSKVPRILKMETVEKVDLQQINHLSGRMKKYLKLSFRTIADLTNARKFIDVKKKKTSNETQMYMNQKKRFTENPKDLITDIRQFDVPYHCRVCIDTGIRAGKWFELQIKDKFIMSIGKSQKKSIPDLKVLAYDIQTSKDPFKFPQKEKDIVMMISLMYEGEGVLIINGGFCQQKVQDFFYEPQGKPQFKCNVKVFNMESQKQTLQMFIDIIKSYKPTVITSFNGDKFDYPFIEARCAQNYIEFNKTMGVINKGGEYFGAYISHLDCYYWVDRDAYLPQGSRGLKAVTRAKLKYEPIQVDPERMVQMARYRTRQLAQYAISDAVATFYLYMKHIHGFIYALSTIIPMMPDQVLRKGSGTLCQNLLMAEAYARNIIFPNKQIQNFQKFYRGHLLDTQTYTGGKVECLRSGIYRADFKTDFSLSPKAFQSLIQSLDQIIQFTVKHESNQHISNIQNIAQVRAAIIPQLQKLRDVTSPSNYQSLPLIYHIDVAAMYPNIIITNRLQPVAVVNDQICSGCLFNSPQYDCKRSLEWEWRGQYFPLNEGEYMLIKEKESMKSDPSNFNKLDHQKNIKTQVKKYCQRIYSKAHIPVSQVRRDTVCMRQNSFYVDTVRAFRDRRYDYKTLTKAHKIKASQRAKQGDYQQQKQEIKLMELFESMQLAHKIILNSFYGYVMRKGSRWYSMETAAMVTYIGSNIINDSKNFIQGRLGKPLELDTDGIWMLLPQGFPQDVKIKFKSGKSVNMSYPCQILNHLIYQKYANPQYQQLINQQNFKYSIRKEMTIAFEIDGPYKAMFIPGGKEKKKGNQLDIQQQSNQMLKKRYVVFNHKNQVSEFKGLEMKRRGQLNIIKMFQSQIFGQYVKGASLKQCYQHCSEVAMKYFNFILKKGQNQDLQGILQKLEESKNLSKDVNDYGQSKGVAITSARRLADYLGPEVVKGKNICLYYIISAYPPKKTVTQRAIPTQIFFADIETQKKYLFKWTKNEDVQNNVDITNILDWDYYKERLSTQIQKMVCIPAVMQNLPNPIPQIQLPDWLQKKTFDMRFHRQQKISMYGFGKTSQILAETQRKNFSSNKKPVQQSRQVEISPKILFEQNKKTFLRKSHKNPHSMRSNFKQWFQYQKVIWRDHKRQLVINQSLKFHQLKSILQISPVENSPGNFTVWYYSGNKIQQLLLNFKRHYYVKSKDGTKKAPRQQGAAQQIVTDEAEFIKMQDGLQTFSSKIFYETKTPLIINLILKKGNLWKISKHLSLYREEDVTQVFGSEYLPKIEDNFMPIVYLSRITFNDRKQIFFLFCPKIQQYYFVFQDNSLGTNKDSLIRLARKTLNKLDASVQVKIENTQIEAGKRINEFLKQLQKKLKQTFLIILESDCSVAELKSKGMHSLQEQMPVLKLRCPNFELSQKITLIDWKPKLLKKAIEQSSSVDSKIVNLLQWARFTHIPICNLAQHQYQQSYYKRHKKNANSQEYQDSSILDYVTNISFGRLLHSGDNVTWWNEYNCDIMQTYQSKAQSDKIMNPGIYTSYCIQMNLDNLAVNAIANSDELGIQDRQTAMMIQNTKKDRNQNASKVEYLDQMTQARRAFEYLRKMIKLWIDDLKVNLQKANDLLRNFHKWITTYSNALYDPLLFKMVNQLMKTMLDTLVRKLTHLGLHIIYASYSKIIVSTGKHTYKQAESSINFILQKCKKQNEKLLGYIILTPMVDYFQVLLYKDPLNFMGIFINGEQSKNEMIPISNQQIEQQNRQEQIDKAIDPFKKNIEYTFEMSKLFNPITRLQFQALLVEFVNFLSQVKKQLIYECRDNKMKLMLHYQQLITQKTIHYINNVFWAKMEEAIENIKTKWEEERSAWKKGDETVGEIQSNHDEGQQEQEDDSYIVQDEDDISYDSIIDQIDKFDQELSQNSHTNKKKKNKKKNKKKQAEQENKIQIDFSVWTDKQLVPLVETIFNLLSNQNIESYQQALSNMHYSLLQKLHEQPSKVQSLMPKYPNFQLPCSSCFLVNQKPGNCEHCRNHLDTEVELQNAIWKMMQQQGRDLYCIKCNQIMQGFIRKCPCGGNWKIQDKPLEWLPFMPREDQSWSYCNKVFDFMGVR